MLNISREQALERYETLPENLKEALFSAANAQIIRRLGETYHLSDDKISILATIAGDVILGFLHPNDLAAEIRSSLNLDYNLNPQLAVSIAQEIDHRILMPFRNDLEKIYKPIPDGSTSLTTRIGAKTVIEIAGGPVPAEAIMEKPKEASGVEVEAPKIVSAQEEKKKEIQPPITQLPITELLTEEPLIIHKEAEFKPISETKKSLGGMFGFLRKKESGAEKKIIPIKAQIEMGLVEADKRGSQDVIGADLRGKAKTEPPAASHSTTLRASEAEPKEEQKELPKVKVINYSEPQTPIIKEKIEMPLVVSEAEPQQKKPVETPPKPALDLRPQPVQPQPVKPVKEEEDVIDLRTFKKI